MQPEQVPPVQLIAVATDLIAGLHWADFETLVDLIFSRGGGRRTSRVGGTMADVDLVLENPLTEERAFVQVKSKADQAVLNDYFGRYQDSGAYQRFFFVCHSPKGQLNLARARDTHLWTGSALAEWRSGRAYSTG